MQLPAEAQQKEYLYLSELTPKETHFRYGSLKIDRSESGEDIHLIVDGERTVFHRGLGAHAPSTVIYDIGTYSDTLTHFIAYLGVDSRMNGGNGVKFTISVSDDGQTPTDPNHPQDGAKPDSGKNPTNPQDGAKPNTGKNPATGDEMNLLFPVLGMTGSLAVLFVLLRRRKQF